MSRSLKILSVYGTRPEVIKLAPVIRCLRGTEEVRTAVLATGQHRDLAPGAEQCLGICPDDSLDLMHPGQSVPRLLSRSIELLTDYMDKTSPDMVLVQGDTTTTLAAAQAAFYCKAPIVHIEAGIRSHNLYRPFPEEMNRRLITSLATLHMAPTTDAARNLAAAGVSPESVFVTGNTVLDSLAYMTDLTCAEDLCRRINIPEGSRFILATVHRRESWGERMKGIGAALRDVIEAHADHYLVIPLHPNPIVKETLKALLEDHPRVRLLEALPYRDFVGLLKCCHLVMSDSGGLQEEAPFFGKPVVVLREETDRPEAVASGTAVLATTDRRKIVSETARILGSPEIYGCMAAAENPYGDGRAAQRIVDAILDYFGRGERLEQLR